MNTWVAVVGPERADLSEEVRNAGQDLGRWLALHGFGLVWSCKPGAQRETRDAFVRAVAEDELPLRLRTIFTRDDLKVDGDRLLAGEQYVVEKLTGKDDALVERSDVVVLVGGRELSLAVAGHADRRNKAVLPLSAMGEGARHFHAAVLHEPELHPWLKSIDKEAFAGLAMETPQALEHLYKILTRFGHRSDDEDHAVPVPQPAATSPVAAIALVPGEESVVFISYCRTDMDAARAIAIALQAAGVPVFFDEYGIEPGDEWRPLIQNVLKKSLLFIPIISKNTELQRRRFFWFEWNCATEIEREEPPNSTFIIPVTLGTIDPQTALVPERFRHFHWYHLRECKPTEEFVRSVVDKYRAKKAKS